MSEKENCNSTGKKIFKGFLIALLVLSIIIYIICGTYKVFRTIQKQEAYNEYVKGVQELENTRKEMLDNYYAEISTNAEGEDEINFEELKQDVYNIVYNEELIAKHIATSKEKDTLSNINTSITPRQKTSDWRVQQYEYYKGDGYYIIKDVSWGDNTPADANINSYISGSSYTFYLTNNDKQILSNVYSTEITDTNTTMTSQILDALANVVTIIDVFVILLITLTIIITCSKCTTTKQDAENNNDNNDTDN